MANQLFNSKPLMINKYVGVLPSRKNRHLEAFINQIPRGCTNIQDLKDNFNSEEACVIGLFSWATPLEAAEPNQSNSAPPGLCMALTDMQSQHQLKLFLVGEASVDFPELQPNTIMYVYGAINGSNTQDFETQSVDCPFVLETDDSNKKLKIFILNRWLYSRLSSEAVKKSARERSPVSVRQSRKSPTPNATSPSPSPIATANFYEYKYTQLSSLANGAKANVCCVIKSFKPKIKTRGTDYYLSFYVVDASHTTGTSVVVFHKMMESLPDIYRVGDIVLMRRVTVQLHQNNLQLKGHFYSAFCILDGREDRLLKPYSTSHNASFRTSDMEAAERIKKWYFENKSLVCYTEQCKLEDVCPGLSFHIVGMVISATPMEKEGGVCLTICDGTHMKTTANPASLDGYPINQDPDLVRQYGHIAVDVVIYNTTALNLGATPGKFVYLYNVYAHTCHAGNVDGEMVFTVNLVINRQDKEFISCSVLPDADSDVLEIKHSLEKVSPPHSPPSHQPSHSPQPQSSHSPQSQSVQRPRASHSPQSSSAILTETGISATNKDPLPSITFHSHTSRPFTSLIDVTSPDAPTPNKYRCTVRPIAINTKSINDIVHLICPACFAKYPVAKTTDELTRAHHAPGSSCTKCTVSPAPLLMYMYMFTMTVEDGTSTCKVLVCREGADALIGLPANLYLDDEEGRKVLEKLTVLFGRNPFSCNMVLQQPLLDICIMSYYSKGLPKSEEERQKAHIVYRLFDTHLSPSPFLPPHH